MIDSEVISEVIKELADTIVVPRFRSLGADDIRAKAGDDVVTIADEEMEVALEHELRGALPGSRVIGEEACAADMGLLNGIGEGLVWLIDPVDGTRNFATGSEHFGVMVALLKDGESLASWIYAPIAGDLTVAEKGAGAFTNGERLVVRESVGRPGVVGRYMAPELRAHVPWSAEVGTGASAFDYPELVGGRWSSILYWRTMPWDHVPGTLILTEAGGHAARLDGAPYRVGDDRLGLLAATSMVGWWDLQARLPGELTAIT